jgi:hypothetical protein
MIDQHEAAKAQAEVEHGSKEAMDDKAFFEKAQQRMLAKWEADRALNEERRERANILRTHPHCVALSIADGRFCTVGYSRVAVSWWKCYLVFFFFDCILRDHVTLNAYIFCCSLSSVNSHSVDCLLRGPSLSMDYGLSHSMGCLMRGPSHSFTLTHIHTLPFFFSCLCHTTR